MGENQNLISDEEIAQDSLLKITRDTLEKFLNRKKRNGFLAGKQWGYTVGPILYRSDCLFSYGIYNYGKKVFHIVFRYHKDEDLVDGIPENSWEVRLSSEESLMPTFGCDKYFRDIDHALSSALADVQKFCILAHNLCHHAKFSGLIKYDQPYL